MHPPDPEMQNPRRVDRHPQARVEHKRRFNEEALETFFNIKISRVVKANFDDAPETALAAALREAMRRKAGAS
jgi:hypothetical protein